MIHHPEKRLLLFGARGKLGTALCKAFGVGYRIDGKSSADLDITDLDAVARYIQATGPELVINAAAFVGIDACEESPAMAFKVNTTFPKALARLSHETGFQLVHISTDAVFDGAKRDFYTEIDCARPINVYGMTKYGGDCCIQAIAEKYYIFRIPLLFGENPKNNQFVEKMLVRIREGSGELRISDDIVTSPSYSSDIARAIKGISESDTAYGLYHLANDGQASLYDLTKALAARMNAKVRLTRCSHTCFKSKGIKNTFTPIRSRHLPPLRAWQDALGDFCETLSGR